MTENELFSAVDSYFVRHLDSVYWSGLDSVKREAVVSMAFTDISTLISGLSLDNLTHDSVVVKAIAEQAVYLSRHYDSIADGKVITSESAEGVSAGYSLIGGAFSISPRAEQLVQYAKKLYICNSARLSRG